MVLLDPDGASPGSSASIELDLRRRVAHHLADRREVLVADTVATFPLSGGSRRMDAAYCLRLGALTIRLLSDVILEGWLDSRGPGISDLAAVVLERELTPDQLFSFVHVAMSTAVEELSHDALVGASTTRWPQAAEIVRRAAFDLLAAWTTRSVEMPPRAAIEDPLTTLHTRTVFNAVLTKECQRAERFEHWLSTLLFDVDNFSEINKAHGYGVGDRILERMGILLRTYFREHDWVARYDEDSIAILLPETTPSDALVLADRTRVMVEDRLTFRDYRTDQRVVVTVSVAAVSARAIVGEPIDPTRFQAEAEAALDRAKMGGRNRVEQVQLLPQLISIEEALVLLGTDIDGIESLVGQGRLEPVKAGRHVRLERAAVRALAGYRHGS